MKFAFSVVLFVIWCMGCSGSNSPPLAQGAPDGAPVVTPPGDDSGGPSPVLDATSLPPAGDAGTGVPGVDSGTSSSEDASTTGDASSSSTDTGAPWDAGPDCGPPTSVLDPPPPNYGDANWTIIGCPGIDEYSAWILKSCLDDVKRFTCMGLDYPDAGASCADQAYTQCGAADTTYTDGGCHESVCFLHFYTCPPGTVPNPAGPSPGHVCIDAGP